MCTAGVTMRRTLLCTLLLAACGPGKADDGESAESAESTSTGEATDTTDPSSPTTPTTGNVEENPAGVCNPNADTACPANYICCSDDPATTAGRIPNYYTNGQIDDVYGVPIFSGNNNPLSFWGQCVEVGGFASPFANGCPVPCNPTWAPDILTEICGISTACCPFTMLDPTKDCVMDPQSGLWRAVTGHDIPALTNWGAQHTTNQDPNGASCTIFASGGGPLDQAVFEDCVAQLTVADQRGFCYDPGQCPCYEDLCAMKNPGYVLRCPSP